ncbi:hypothetical protein GNX18_10245 [Microbulbifer sp. SH-1]|nr:hypothetical protein GNX18_10245 [Microbulbifer sp. SH-1]
MSHSPKNKADMEKELREAMQRVDKKEPQFMGNTQKALIKRKVERK